MSFASTNLTEVWRWQDGTAITDSPGNQAATVDPDGNLIVAGSTSVVYNGDERNHSDFAVYKLDGTTGDEIWTKTFTSGSNTDDFGAAVDADASGDIIVAGSTTGSWSSSISEPGVRDLAAFKLDGATGEEIWRYQSLFDEITSSSNGDDFYGGIYGLAADSTGDVFIAGYAYVTTVIENEYHAEFIVGKLNGSTGALLWMNQGGPANSDVMLWACAVDSTDSVIVAGHTEGNISATAFTAAVVGVHDFLVMKYDPDGEGAWVYQYGSADVDDILTGITIDSEDNVYVCGGGEFVYSPDLLANYSVVTKLSGADGAELWEHRAGGPTEDRAIYTSVAVDETTGTVVACGQTEGVWVDGQSFSGELDFMATALDMSTGEEVGRWQDGTGSYDRLESAAFDENGGLFLVGATSGNWTTSQQGDLDFMAAKFALGYASSSVDNASVGVDDESSGNTSYYILVGGVTAALFALVFCMVAGFCVRKKIKNASSTPTGFRPPGGFTYPTATSWGVTDADHSKYKDKFRDRGPQALPPRPDESNAAPPQARDSLAAALIHTTAAAPAAEVVPQMGTSRPSPPPRYSPQHNFPRAIAMLQEGRTRNDASKEPKPEYAEDSTDGPPPMYISHNSVVSNR